MTLVVFAGPSISSAGVTSRLPHADVRPPAYRGDLYDVREEGATLIVIIDGVFAHQMAVAPSEVVDVLEDGAQVLGASSLGAVRAAECWPAGMRGIGRVFRLYRMGALTSDDEVAVVTDADAEHAALSVALVNVRFAARRAWRRGLVDSAGALRLVQAAESEHFARRTWQGIVAAAGLSGNGALREFCEGVDVKRDDAHAAVRHVAQTTDWSTDGAASSSPRHVSRRARYPGHDLTFGLDAEELSQALMVWLFGSARYQRYIWPLMVGEPEFETIESAAWRPKALRDALAATLARLLQDSVGLRDRLWEELDFLDELDAELERWNAFRQLALPEESDPAAARNAYLWARERLAVAHGYPSWNSLTEDVVDDRLFGAIPFQWIREAEPLIRAAWSQPGAIASPPIPF